MNTMKALLIAVLFTIPALQEAAASEPESFSQAELDQMLAPVALYPDTVLSHLLIAATYPLEVVQATRWVQEHPGLDGEEAVAAVEDQDWDPSVKALVAFPDLLRRMNDDLEWTQRLGEAFMVQEEDVVTTVQGLRERAYAAGNLRSNEQVQVVREREVIYVEPARPNIVYVPYYDPRVVYGNWWWPGYQPVYWKRPFGFNVGVTYHWGTGYRIMPSWFYISSFHWTRRQVVVVHHHHYHNRPRPVFHSSRAVGRYGGANRWEHNPRHRRGVAYRTPRLESVQLQQHSQTTVNRPRLSSDRRAWAANRRGNMDFSSGRSFQRPTAQAPRAQSPQAQAPRRQTQRAPVAARTAPVQSVRARQSVDSGRSFQRPTAQAPRARAPQVQTPRRQSQRAPATSRPAPAQSVRARQSVDSGRTFQRPAVQAPRAQAPQAQAPRARAPQITTAPQAQAPSRPATTRRAAPAQRATPRVRASEEDRQQER
jgi:hypothetical protein